MPALWMLIKRCGLKGRMSEKLFDLQESTEYKVCSKEGMNSAWVPARGLREG